MLPAQRNKVDISSLTEEEQKLFRLYGKLPNRKDLLGNKLKERKYFDSGDYALSKAGKAPQQDVGTAIPNPETIPHASTVSSPGTNGSIPASSSPSNGGPTNMQGNGGVTSPINMPPRSAPQVSAFPTANGNAGSPSKEGSSLGREEVGAEDQEMAD